MQTWVQNPPLVTCMELRKFQALCFAVYFHSLPEDRPCLWRVLPVLLLSSYSHVCNGRADETQETNGHKYFLLFLLTEGQLRETESRAQAGRVKT